MRFLPIVALALIGCAGSRPSPREPSVTVRERSVESVHVAAGLRTGPHALSLEEASLLALERHPELAVRRLDPAIAATFEQLERAEFGVTLFADGQYQQELSRETNRATMMQFDVEGSRTTAGLGLRQRLPTGTTLETALGLGRDESNRAPEQQEVRASLTLTQSLLRGLDPDVNLASVRQAELERRASEHQLRAFVAALVLEMELAYWQLALAQRSLRIHEESLTLAEREAEVAAERVAAGDLAPADLPVTRALVAQRRQALIDARAAAAAWRLRLGRMLGLDPESSTLELTDAIAIEPRPLDDPDAHRALALRLRADLAEARARLAQNELATVASGNGLLPRLDLFVQLAKTGFGSSFAEAVGAIGAPTYELTVGLSFEQLLGNDAATATHEAAQLRRERAERAVENLESLVLLDVGLALNELARARAQIEASRESAAEQARVVEAERERVQAGESPPLLVAQAERDLVAARIAEIEAQVAYRVALVSLYAAEGSLLPRRGVRLRGDEAVDLSPSRR
ncbi:MAG: TolC family protein [Myxococcota bacterium]|nr:TolC family protein [Myxococcota bacterium]